MATKIRLRRMGAKGRAFYRVVVADSRSPRDGRFIETLGYYDPHTDPPTINVSSERTKYWLGVGARPTDVTRGVLKRAGIIEGAKPEPPVEGQD